MAQTRHFCSPSYFYPSETELYYLQSRYYDPSTCRFINADIYVSTGQGLLGHNMFAYCLNNPVCRIEVLGATSEELFDGDGNPDTDDDKRFDGGKMGSPGGGGTGQAGGLGDSNGNTDQTNNSVPKYALDTLDYIRSHNGSPPKGYKGGKPYDNDGRDGGEILPDEYGLFREYDVHPRIPGQNRGLERIVTGNGAAWYTPNHYTSFIIIK